MQATYTKTFRGKTAGGWLKTATVAQMQAGTHEVVSTALPGCILMSDADGDLVITDFSGTVARIVCSPRASRHLARLEAKAEAACR